MYQSVCMHLCVHARMCVHQIYASYADEQAQICYHESESWGAYHP